MGVAFPEWKAAIPASLVLKTRLRSEFTKLHGDRPACKSAGRATDWPGFLINAGRRKRRRPAFSLAVGPWPDRTPPSQALRMPEVDPNENAETRRRPLFPSRQPGLMVAGASPTGKFLLNSREIGLKSCCLLATVGIRQHRALPRAAFGERSSRRSRRCGPARGRSTPDLRNADDFS
jgi:hypothetical protein